LLANTQRRGDRLRHQHRVGHGGELDQPDAVWEVRENL
jgi:hypothetical protein